MMPGDFFRFMGAAMDALPDDGARAVFLLCLLDALLMEPGHA